MFSIPRGNWHHVFNRAKLYTSTDIRGIDYCFWSQQIHSGVEESGVNVVVSHSTYTIVLEAVVKTGNQVVSRGTGGRRMMEPLGCFTNPCNVIFACSLDNKYCGGSEKDNPPCCDNSFTYHFLQR